MLYLSSRYDCIYLVTRKEILLIVTHILSNLFYVAPNQSKLFNNVDWRCQAVVERLVHLVPTALDVDVIHLLEEDKDIQR